MKGTRLHADQILHLCMYSLSHAGCFGDYLKFSFISANHVSSERTPNQVVPNKSAGRMQVPIRRALFMETCTLEGVPNTSPCSALQSSYLWKKVMLWEFYNQIIDEFASYGPIVFRLNSLYFGTYEWVVNLVESTKPNYNDGHVWTWEDHLRDDYCYADDWRKIYGVRYIPRAR